MSDAPTTGMREEVAIIGMAGRFPGATDLEAFWANLRDGHESIRSFSQAELTASGVSEDTQRNPDFVNAGSVMDDPDCFDAAFFGMSAREAETTDPQHRVFLECAWSALEHAGYDSSRVDGLVGVFGGVGPNTYYQENLASHPQLLETLGRYPVMIGNEREYCITRTAFKLNLKGPAVSLNTACSTSGVAVHLACQSLLLGECDMALAGGARIRTPLHSGYIYQEDGIPSPDGHCRAFDARAQGTVIASGAAILVLKRLSDAQKDGDTIHAVIKGSAINNDGSAKAGFTAPSVQGQSEVIAEALAVADVSPRDISYVEAHGTGTTLGDPIEVAALSNAFRRGTDGRQYCAIGSLKTNIGHLDAAAGAAGIIKTVLAMKHRQIPPSLHFEAPNPQIDFANSPFWVCDRLTDWTTTTGVRRAGVSSFGLGGTNSHIVLEEAPSERPNPLAGSHELLVLSAKTDSALAEQSRSLGEHLARFPSDALSDIAHTLQVGRQRFQHRAICVASSTGEAAEILGEESRQRTVCQCVENDLEHVVFMFPGGGAQYVDMARDLYRERKTFREIVDQCAELVEPQLGMDFRSVLYPSHSTQEVSATMERPSIALPALFAIEYALARQWMQWGVAPSFMIGHSMGEYTAACLAGTMTLSDALGLVTIRGQLFERLSDGAMLSVPMSAEDVERNLVGGVAIAAENRPDACVVSGPAPAIQEMHAAFAEQDIESRLLHISVAAHSPMVDPILGEFSDFVKQITLSPPQVPWVSNVTGTWITESESMDPGYWVRHLRSTVKFSDGLRTIMDDSSAIMLEVGPGQTLSTFARQHPSRGKGRSIIASVRHPNETAHDLAFVLGALGRLWLAGIEIEWDGYREGASTRRIPLPTYPFARDRRWIDPALGDPREQRATNTAMTTSGQRTDTGVQHPAPEPLSSTSKAPESRQMGVAREIVNILHELSGLDPADIDANRSFLELGFDSLFLTQASAAFHRAFQVRTTFRQLFDEAPTVNTLAAFIESKLPADAVESVATPASSAGVEETPPRRDSGEPTPRPSTGAGGTGPWKPIDKSAGSGFTPQQLTHLEQLAERINTRTGGSKRLTQANRSHLADPRTVAGFRLPWKEMVYPIVVDRSAGSRVWDIDGNEFIDLTMGFGVSLFGHSPPFVVNAVAEQLGKGIEIGPQTPLAGEVAALVCEFTGMERAAFCNTGSEAVLAAIRVARTVTGRTRIATFAGDYHGIFDEVLVKGVTVGGQRRSIPVAPGIPPHAVDEVVVLDYDDPESIDILKAQAHELAAILVEPVQSRHPDLQPQAFLKELRQLATATDVPLIFDEMITGFRSHPGGAQAIFGVQADIATYGKVIGGGFPIGVVAGQRRYLDALDGGMWNFGDDSMPEVGVTWFAGTFVRHPVALSAARAALRHMKAAGQSLQGDLNDRTTRFVQELNRHFELHGYPIYLEHFSSLFLIVFKSQQELSSLFYQHLRDNGIHITENRAAFLSTAHSDEDLKQVAEAFKTSAQALCDNGFLPFHSVAGAIAASGPDRTTDAVASISEVPLTEGQEEIWLASCVGDEANCAFNLCNTLALEGPLDPDNFSLAVQHIVDRHEALRTTIHGERGVQLVAPSGTVRTAMVDLSSLDEQDRQVQVDAMQHQAVARPFDLANGPLLRSTLLKLGEERHLYFLTVHHIICDGWSTGVILHDLGEYYTALVEDRPASPPAAFQLSEYAKQSRLDYERDGESTKSYWLKRLGVAPPVADLPTDRPRPRIKTFNAERRERTLDSRIVAKLEQAAKDHGCTVFTLLVAGYNALLHQRTGQTGFVLGISVAGQPMTGNSHLVAHCVSLLPLTIPVDRAATTTEYVTSVRRELYEAFDHHAITFGSLLKDLKLSRDPGRNPLVSVVFNMDSSTHGLRFGPLTVAAGSNPRAFETFELFVNVVRGDGHMTVECTFNTDLFDFETIDKHLADFEYLVDGLGQAESDTVGSLPVLADLDQAPAQQIQGAITDWTPACLHELIEAQVRRTPELTAVVGPDGAKVSYRELDRRAERVASALRSQGVSTESIVGVCLERSVDLVAALLGTLKAGGAYLPLDPTYPDTRLRYLVEDTRARVILTDSGLATRIRNGVAGDTCVLAVDGLSDLAENGNSQIGAAPTADNLAYIIYTSGSTGSPKGVMNTHGGVCNRIRWMQAEYDIDSSDAVLQKTPFTFDVSVWEFFWPLMTGARLVVARPGGHQDPTYLADRIADEAITVIHFVPSMLRMFLEEPELASRCRSLRYVICSGEALSPELQGRFFELLDTSLHNLYGPTEAAVDVTAWACRRDEPGAAVPIGYPIANTQIHILTDALVPVSAGEQGELYIGGVQVARGYWGQPALTAERFVPDPFSSHAGAILYKTGDLGRRRPDGAIEFLGRRDDQVKVRGFRIEVGEIEAVLAEHPAVQQAAVTPHEHPPGTVRLAAYLSLRQPGNAEAVVPDWRTYLGDRLPEYMIPSWFTIVDAMPLTPTGKLDRRALPAPHESRRGAGETELSTETERIVARIWREVLGTEDVGTTDDFFTIGGHSLLAVRVVAKIREHFTITLPLRIMFEASTVEALAGRIDAAVAEGNEDREVFRL